MGHEQEQQYASSYEYPSYFSLAKVKCEKGWIPYHTSCYKLYTTAKTFEEANKQCESDKPRDALGSTLLTGWDEYEVLFMESFLRDEQIPNFDPNLGLPDGYWIGLQNKEWRKGSGKRWGWVDRWPLSYTRRTEQMPSDMRGDCGFMHTNGKWANEDCQ